MVVKASDRAGNFAQETASIHIPAPNAPTYTPASAPVVTLHIGDLDRSAVPVRNKWKATVTIRLHNANELPVAGAKVYGKWSNDATGSPYCITNSKGVCSVTKTSLTGGVPSVTFTVTKVVLAGATYQSTANHDPDGESNGTTIVALKP